MYIAKEVEKVDVQYSVSNDEHEEKKKKKGLHWLTVVLLIIDFCAVVCFGLWYIPDSPFRNWYVTTAMATQTHQYLAYTFYSEEDISQTLSQNAVISTGESTDVSDITFIKTDTSKGYASFYEQQVLENPNNDSFKVIDIAEDNWHGWLVVVYEPTKLNLAICKGWNGDRCTQFAARYNSKLVINAGIFYRDEAGVLPLGTTISSGKVIHSDSMHNIIGMTKEGVLVLNKGETKDVLQYDMKWACEMPPFLIVNGKKTQFKGNGGYGIQPRTAIGQRKDGIVIFLIIDGRQVTSSGVSVVTLADIFEKYGCINAANLDGGGSSTLVVDGKLVNSPQGHDYERYIYDAIYLEN